MINSQFYFIFLEAKDLCLYHWLMLKSITELAYTTRKSSVKDEIFKKFQRTFIFDRLVVRKIFLACLETFKSTF